MLWLEEHEHLPPHEVATALEQRSGLLALAGTSDMREVQAAADRGDPDARLPIDVDIHRHDHARGDRDITAATAAVRALVITAREDLQIAG